MPVKILIVDPVATNRIVLKVKLLSAFYEVQHASGDETVCDQIKAAVPDVILLGSGLPLAQATALVAKLDPGGDALRVPVIALLPQTDPGARQQLLSAGVDEVLERPLDDAYLLARLRCLLRADQTERELRLRDSTRRALGLAEAAAEFESPPRVAVSGADAAMAARLAPTLKRAMPGASVVSDMRASFLIDDDRAVPDVFVVVLSEAQPQAGLALISNIKARPRMRDAAILAVAPRGARQHAVMALDHGASDLVPDDVPVAELSLRLHRLATRKRTAERLRKTVQSGLHAALTDPLTGLYNRRYAIPHLQRMAETCRVSERSFAVMILDLDHFKRVNDQHGHAAGDSVLMDTAQRLRDNLRAVDLVARIGGEEFLVAMPDTDRGAAQAAADRLCRVIADRPYRVPDAKGPIHLTASIGVVLSTGLHADLPGGIEDLMKAADRALYGSKSHGRNQFTLARNAA